MDKESDTTHPPMQNVTNQMYPTSPVMWQASTLLGMDAGGPWVVAETGGRCRQALCVLLVVCCVQMWDFPNSISSYAQKYGILGQICPTRHPTIPPKNTLAEVEYLCLHLQDTLQNREGFCL
jgi:hypothetical protein